MPLTGHLRELRNRLFRSALAITAGAIVGWIYYDEIFRLISQPFLDVVSEAQENGRNVQLTLTGVADPFVLQIKVALVSGVVLASPIWLYQLWRFVTPGLHRHERRWSIIVVAIATPLFCAGVALAYVFMPNALDFLLGFTPESVSNFVDVSRYVTFFLRTVIVFGIGFLLPLFALMLNLAGVLPASTLINAWRWILVGIFLFAAIATPDGNPITMTMLAVPIVLLLTIVMGIAWLHDRRKGKRADEAAIPDDEMSTIEEPTALDDPGSVDSPSSVD